MRHTRLRGITPLPAARVPLARTAVVLVVAVVGGLCAGCSYQLVSPPAHIVSMESAAPVKPGETVVGARGGLYAAIFDPGALAASGGVRRGVRDGVELNAEGTYAYVAADESPNLDRNLFAGHVGAKVGNGIIATTAGVGGGFAPAAGGFTAVDVGGIVSYPNCYVIPLLAPTAFVSLPLAARTVTFDNGQTSKAPLSWGFGAAAGVEIPLDRARCREGRTPTRLQLGTNVYSIRSTEGPVTTTTANGPTTTTRASYGAVGWVVSFEFPL